MVPPDIALAEHLVKTLNAATPEKFVAERAWVPEWDARSELDTLQLAVVPAPDPAGQLVERDQIWETWPIDFGFAKRLKDREIEEIDDLIATVDDVRESLQLTEITLTDGRVFHSTGYEFLARFDPTRLNRQRVEEKIVYSGVFLSVFRIPFQRTD